MKTKKHFFASNSWSQFNANAGRDWLHRIYLDGKLAGIGPVAWRDNVTYEPTRYGWAVPGKMKVYFTSRENAEAWLASDQKLVLLAKSKKEVRDTSRKFDFAINAMTVTPVSELKAHGYGPKGAVMMEVQFVNWA